ncbi:MAG: HepT-like ribonuclease domain-containing protein [Candidatus Bathyarchaeia archaeon]
MELKAILSEALNCIKRARSIKPSSDVEASALRWEVYATLQNVLDVMSMVVVDLGLRKPSSYSELGRIFYEGGLVNVDAVEIVRRIATVRNTLAHAYRRISIEDLLDIVNRLLPDVEKLIGSISRIIEEKGLDPDGRGFESAESMLNRMAETFKKHKVMIAYLFGSRARGDFREDSDYDIAVLFEKYDATILNEAELALEIADSLGIPVDKVDVSSLNKADPTLISRVLKEGVVIYQCDEALRRNWEKKTYFELLGNTDLYAVYFKRVFKRQAGVK